PSDETDENDDQDDAPRQPPAAAPNFDQAPADEREARRSRVRVRFVGQNGAEQNGEAQPAEATPRAPVAPGADIVVSVGPNGIVIASEDLEALDEFEDLFRQIAESSTAGAEYTVFYLKYAQAEVAAVLLKEILTGDTGEAGGAEGSLLGDLAGAALGDSGGGIMGSLLGLGGDGGLGSLSASGTFTVVAEPRLNALVVQAGAADLDLIEQMLKVIDQESSPEDVQTIPPPRLIPVFNTSAEEVAAVVRQVYAQQMASTGGGRDQPSPQDLIRALRGGRGGGRDNSRQAQEQQMKMTVSVDRRSNALVVSAPDPIFKDVKSLVQQLDQIGVESAEVMEVVTLRRANPEVVQRALSSIAGSNVTVNTTPAAAGAGASPALRTSPPTTSITTAAL
ncbi:MAG: secretin N-terminal domain-containing protein, partial [Pirellulales bacterium]